MSVARYWSPKAWRPMTIGLVHPGTRRGMLEITIGSRKMTPPRMLRIVPLGERHILFRPNSATRASSGVIVAHLTPTPCSLMALAASTVTWSSVALRCWIDRSKYLRSTSRYGWISRSLMKAQMMRVISSPSSSTTGPATLIFAMGLRSPVGTGSAWLQVRDVGLLGPHGLGGFGERRVVRRAGLEQCHDLGTTVAGAGDQLLDLVLGEQFGQRLAVSRAAARHRHHRVAVRAQRQGAHAADWEAELLGDVVGEPRGVEHARLPQHPVLREPGSDLRQRRHLVQRVGHDDDDGIGRVAGHPLGHRADDLGIGFDQVHPAHARLAGQACGDDDDLGAGDHLVPRPVRARRLADDPRLETLDRA